MMMLCNYRYEIKVRITSLLITMFMSFYGLLAQTETKFDSSDNQEISRVRWVAEYPSIHEKQHKENIFHRFGELLIGKKPTSIVKPMAVLAQNPDSFIILDQGSHSIVEIDNKVSKKPRVFEKLYSNFPSMVGLCILPDGSLLFSDSSTENVFVLSSNKKEIRPFSQVKLEQPTGVAYSAISNLIWVLETRQHKITILDEKGKKVKEIGKRGNAPGEFNFPTHIWIDTAGLVYVVDSMNFRVQILNKDGDIISVFGEVGNSSGYFARQKGIATDSHGNIYVVDALFNTVQIFDKDGTFLYNFGTRGRNENEFWMPNGIYVDNKDYIYVADSYNSRVQIFQLLNGETK